MNVLLIETDLVLRRSLEFALTLRGHDVISTVSAAEAIEICRESPLEQPFSLVAIGSARQDGEDAAGPGPPSRATTLELCGALRGLPPTARSTILVLSPRNQPDRIVEALDAGVDGYLAVPLDAGQLRSRMTFLEQAGVARAGERDTVSSSRDQALIERAVDAILIVDAGGGMIWSNRVAHATFDEATLRVGTSLYTICHPDDTGKLLALLANALEPEGRESSRPQGFLRLRGHDDRWRDVDVVAVNLLDEPAVRGIVLIARDDTGLAARREQIRVQTTHDSHTGLLTRSLFMMYLEHAVARSERRDEPVVIMFLDVDNLKIVNARHGRAAGDEAIAVIAERLAGSLRATDTAARVGDDEFTVLLENVVSEAEVGQVADRILRRLREPIPIAGSPPITVSASIGLAFSHPGSTGEPGTTEASGSIESRARDLLRRADIALSRAKAAGKDRWVTYDSRAIG